MRTTIDIEDGLLLSLKREAEQAGVPLTRLVNRVLEVGLEKLSPAAGRFKRPIITHSLGEPTFPIEKALMYASDLEDEEILRKLELRK